MQVAEAVGVRVVQRGLLELVVLAAAAVRERFARFPPLRLVRRSQSLSGLGAQPGQVVRVALVAMVV